MFVSTFGTRPADALKVREVHEWLDATGHSTSTNALAVIIKTVFNWAVIENPCPRAR